MTEKSYWWTTGAAGDGAATYTRADHSDSFSVVAASLAFEGVAKSYLNSMVGSVPGANTARIGTGGAMADGKPYKNSAAVDVNIPSAVGGGNTRIDRVVLRADWTAQTVRITRIAGVDAASPAVPAITQTPGTTYDIKLYQALVTTGGVVTLTDERVFALPSTDTIIAAAIQALAVTTAKIALNAIGFAQMVASAAGLSVIGRSANSAGNFAEIVFGADGDVLRRSGTTLAAGKLIGDINVTAGGLTNASLANRTRKFAAPVNGGMNQTDSIPAGPGTSGAFLADNKWTTIGGSFVVPSDYVSGMTVSPILFSAYSGDVYMEFSARGGAIGANLASHTVGSPGTYTAVPIVANQIKAMVTLDLTAAGFVAGDIVAIIFGRQAIDPLDTTGAVVLFEQFLVSYTADM